MPTGRHRAMLATATARKVDSVVIGAISPRSRAEATGNYLPAARPCRRAAGDTKACPGGTRERYRSAASAAQDTVTLKLRLAVVWPSVTAAMTTNVPV